MPGLRRPDEEAARRIEEFWETRRRERSRFAEGFPDTYEAYLFLYCNYMDEEIFAAVAQAAATIGEQAILLIMKEFPAGEDGLHDAIIPLEEALQQWEEIPGGLEFYLASPTFEWLVWAYHEPCLHLGGSRRFIDAFKGAYPAWEEMYSPWYEETGIPVCPGCGVWWRPGWGDWQAHPWHCPACRRAP
jgi:hypothetical protein